MGDTVDLGQPLALGALPRSGGCEEQRPQPCPGPPAGSRFGRRAHQVPGLALGRADASHEIDNKGRLPSPACSAEDERRGDDGNHDRGDDDEDTVALGGEGDDRHGDPQDGGGDEQEQAGHHQRPSLMVPDPPDHGREAVGEVGRRAGQPGEIPVGADVLGMMGEGDGGAEHHDQQAGQDPGPQQVADGQFDPADPFLGPTVVVGRAALHHRPLRSISRETHSSTITNTVRMSELCSRPSSRDPPTAPMSTPVATGPATNGSMSPRAKYTPALAAAVTPIMKLLVAVDTLIGRRMARSMAGTLRAPLPIPRSPLTTPATYMRPSPV